MQRVTVFHVFVVGLLLGWGVSGRTEYGYAQDEEGTHTVVGTVQNQDLRRVDQAIVQVRDQEGNMVVQGVTNQAKFPRLI